MKIRQGSILRDPIHMDVIRIDHISDNMVYFTIISDPNNAWCDDDHPIRHMNVKTLPALGYVLDDVDKVRRIMESYDL